MAVLQTQSRGCSLKKASGGINRLFCWRALQQTDARGWDQGWSHRFQGLNTWLQGANCTVNSSNMDQEMCKRYGCYFWFSVWLSYICCWTVHFLLYYVVQSKYEKNRNMCLCIHIACGFLCLRSLNTFHNDCIGNHFQLHPINTKLTKELLEWVLTVEPMCSVSGKTRLAQQFSY